MRILMFGMSSYPGGIENYIANYFLAKDFAENIKIDFVTYENGLAYADKIEKYGHKIQRVPHLKKNPFGYVRAVDKLLKQNTYDCVYLNMLSAANVIPLRLAVKRGVSKIVAHAHANSTVKGFVRRILHKINKNYCIKHANYKFACSKQAGEWLFNTAPCQIIPNAIDVSRFSYNQKFRQEIREKYGVLKEDVVFGHVGRFAEEKNHGFLIEVFSNIANQIKNAKLMLVGDGAYHASAVEKVNGLNLNNKVIFAGTSSETEKFYSAFDCFIFPSVFEGFGMAALEAQASGLKTFCSSCLSPELKVVSLLTFLPLEMGAKFWADEICLNKFDNPREITNFPKDFDICLQRKKLLEILR